MPLKAKLRVLAAKQETTAGTAIATTNTDSLWVYDAKIEPEIGYNERPNDGSLGNRTGVVGAKKGKASFKLDVKSSGTAGTSPQWALTLLPACGMKETTGSWAPSSATSDQKPITINLYEDGLVKSICGAVGTVSFDGEAGKPGVMSFEFEGIWVAPTDHAILTPEVDTVKPPAVKGATFTLGSAIAPVSKVSLMLGNKYTVREDITQSTGYAYAVITDRMANGKIDPEATTVATRDVFNEFIGGTEQAVSLVIGSVAGNITTFGGPKCQTKQISEGARNDIVTHEIDFNMNVSSGNDEFTIVFS